MDVAMHKPALIVLGGIAILLGLVFAWWAVQAVWLSAFTNAEADVLEQRFWIRAIISMVSFALAAYLLRRGSAC